MCLSMSVPYTVNKLLPLTYIVILVILVPNIVTTLLRVRYHITKPLSESCSFSTIS